LDPAEPSEKHKALIIRRILHGKCCEAHHDADGCGAPSRAQRDNLLLSEDAMARAVITTDFASPAETAQVLGVSRANREKLVRMAELAISRTRNRRGKAGSNGARTISRRARKRR
jgi:hypothetical protein